MLILMFSIKAIAQPGNGSLVIVGGGLEENNRRVYSRMIELAGGPEKATFAVIPSASGVAMQSFILFRSTLASYGVNPANVQLIEIAAMDDDSTTNLDEASWVHNGSSKELADRIRKCSCVWFTGGDQLRTTKTLYNPDGSYTPVLQAVWDVYRNGGVIGGSSAGAAIMSDPMIGDGASMDALERGVTISEVGQDSIDVKGVLISKGLGFFPGGLVDQHFEARARIGRLIVALHQLKANFSKGFGIDENTAIIYSAKTGTFEVAGVSGVTVVNTSNAHFSDTKTARVGNLVIDYLTDGDIYDLKTGMIKPSPDKVNVEGKEKYKQPLFSGGVFSSGPTFRELFTMGLIDNQVARSASSVAFFKPDAAFLVTLFKTPASSGYVSNRPGLGRLYTVQNIKMDMDVVDVTFSPEK